jgi:GNAT superfamily N-acetyltransferase
VDARSGLADASFLVEDAYRGRGLATRLVRRLTEIAEARGVRGFRAVAPSADRGMLRVFEHCGYPVAETADGEFVYLRIPFEDVPRAAW